MSAAVATTSPVRQPPRTGRVVFAVVVVLAAAAAVLASVSRQESTDPRVGVAVTPSSVQPPATDDSQQRDALAADPMPTLAPAAALPHPLAPDAGADAFVIPEPSTVTAGVDSGFAMTPEGAVAQLAAIDEAALEGMNLAQASNVYGEFAEPGADPVEAWSAYRFVSTTLSSAGIPDGSSRVTAAYLVSEAQVKGVLDDGRFVLACVNGEFDVWLDDQLTRIGAADCARMVWVNGGWHIGAGSQPANPPNAWPGTADSARAGWRPITRAH